MEHPIAHPRNAIALGVMFAIVAIVYFLLSHDAAGTTMISALAIAMTLFAYVLAAGSPRG